MPDLSSYTRKGRTFRVGLSATINNRGENAGVAMAGERVEIRSIRDDAGRILIGIRGRHRENWHDLDGATENGTGYWLELTQACEFLDMECNEPKHIKDDLQFKGRNLKGMKCKILTSIQGSAFIVEFEENIGGISCDGLGRRGHCLPVSSNILSTRPGKKEKTKKELVLNAVQSNYPDGSIHVPEEKYHPSYLPKKAMLKKTPPSTEEKGDDYAAMLRKSSKPLDDWKEGPWDDLDEDPPEPTRIL